LAFDQKMQQLQDELLMLGSMVDKGLARSVEALARRELAKAWELLAKDGTIKRRHNAIEAETLCLITTQQPVAGDLRTLVAVLEIAAELARMGDLTAEINELSLQMGSEPLPRVAELGLMADRVRAMLDLALTALARRDAGLARSIPEQDDEVDGCYRRLGRSLRTLADGAQGGEQCVQLLRVAHHLERAADRVVNICEWVVYAVTGELVEFDDARV
jgi:phosphate transport system protein